MEIKLETSFFYTENFKFLNAFKVPQLVVVAIILTLKTPSTKLLLTRGCKPNWRSKIRRPERNELAKQFSREARASQLLHTSGATAEGNCC